ncbi:MAG: TonB-dependent receptor [Novosphingobium sp.]
MKKFTAVALATASLLPLAAPAYAQDTASEGYSNGEEIVVQARRRDESVQDVPLSVQAVTGAELQKLEIRQFEDVTKVVPGLSLSKDGSTASASLRGINFDARASGASTTIEFYRNDSIITAGALFQAVYDIGQVEVLRGPQGTLRGRASPSGSISVTTRKPDLSEAGGYVSGTLAERGKWNFNGAVNVPVIADKVGIRVAGYMGSNRGNNVYGLNVVTGAVDKDVYDRNRAVRVSVRVDPFDGDLTGDFSFETLNHTARRYNQVQSYNEFLGSSATATTSPRFVSVSDRLGVGATANTDDQNIKMYNWQVTGRQWGQRLTYVGSRTVVQQQFFVYSDGAGLFATPYSVTAPASAPTNMFGQLTNGNVTQTSHELRLQNDERVAGLFDYVIGAFRTTASSPTILATPTTTSSPFSVTPVSSGLVTSAGTFTAYTLNSYAYSARLRFRDDQESSLFGNLTVHLGENTELSGGLRHIWFKADSGLTIGSFATPMSSWYNYAAVRRCYGNPTVTGCLPTKEATIYAASLKHKFSDDLMAYFSFGTSWRPGNSLIGFQGTAGTFLSQFLNMPDETSKSFEIGFKSSWLDRRLRFNVAAFYQKFNNYALYVTTPIYTVSSDGSTLNSAFSFAAAVPATVKGFEAELSFAVSPNFSIGATVAFADSKGSGSLPCDGGKTTAADIVALIGAANVANQVATCAFNGPVSSAARWSGTVQAEYSHPLGNLGEGFLRGFVNWKGDAPGDYVNPNDQVSAYALADLYAGVRSSNNAWEASLFVKNLFNTKRVLSRGSAPSATADTYSTTATYNYIGISTTDPREVGVALRFSFGSR